jgi:ketosteroid isomerase-like protein
MRAIKTLCLIIFACISVAGQSDLQKLVDTEHAFAKLAAERGNRTAFLAFMADDALAFVPDRTSAKTFWSARGESKALLSWAPNYADVSSSGIIGYTTGNWEFRAKGQSDGPSAFGEFVTIWVRQPDGKYKWVVDIGIDHEKPASYSTDWTTSKVVTKDPNERNTSAADSASGFYSTMAEHGIRKAYETFAVDDLRAFRENANPFVGKKMFLSSLKKEKAVWSFSKKSTFFGSADIAYSTNTYTKTIDGKITEKGNVVQIWKLIRGKWRIVLDIFKPVA